MRHIHLEDYKITLGDADAALQEFLKHRHYSSIIVLVDENSHRHCLPKLTIDGPVTLIKISSGEQYKTIATCQNIWSALVNSGADRHSLMINLGGGVIGDMGGFCASTYMRGIDFIQIPTTLLSQVDASIGGKLGVDFMGLKNFVGLFNNPEEVIVDPQFLNTLDPAEFRSGYAEMVKHALIKNDQIWHRLTLPKNWKEQKWSEEIYDSILIKKDVVQQDPTEKGLRKILNFGHTIGHAVESLSFETDKPFLHGEAIAIGMICESILSERVGSAVNMDQVRSYLLKVYDDIDHHILAQSDKILEKLKSDKKNKGGELLFALLKKPGEAVYDVNVTSYQIRQCLIDAQALMH